MYDDYEGFPYYEPTVADEIFMEYREKLKDALHESIKSEIENIKADNIKLKKQNDEIKQRERDIIAKENILVARENNLKREVKSEFYKTNIEEILQQYIEECEVWFASENYVQEEKCIFCNKDRKLVAKFINGQTSEIACECAKKIRQYIPAISDEKIIKFNKKYSDYPSERKFYFSRSYYPSKGSYDSDYIEFKIGYLVDVFNDETIIKHESVRYDEKLGFRSKDECQKYCDWLNNNQKVI